jgi:cyclopropane-fatty-acyl-phospholipid synthase
MDAAARRAGALLTRVFEPTGLPVTFRLWDGTVVDVGGRAPFELVFRSRAIFRRLLLSPTPLRFGEAYIEGDVDIEGDFFAAMEIGQRLEGVRPSLGTRLAAALELVRP